jgi:hypothetical protein
LERLRQDQFYAKLEKSEFWLDSTSFLGNVIFGEGLSIDSEKVKAVVEWGRPTSVHEIQSFLGLADYYHHFIDGFSKLLGLLTAHTRKNVRYLWLDVCKERFQELKKWIVSTPILTLTTKSGNFVVYSDTFEKRTEEHSYTK